MGRILVSALLLAALPAAAGAQVLPGLDLSQPPKKEEPKEELPPLDLSKPAEPARKAPAEERPRAVLPFSEKDVALGDKVKAVQRKGFMKRGRLEVTPLFATTVNDAFYQKIGGGLRLAYNLQDSFAVAIRGSYYRPYRTDNVREGKIAFQSQLLSSQLDGQLILGGIWSPVYGKAAFLGESIVHFDVFLSAGFGLVWTATGDGPRYEGAFCADLPLMGERCPKLAADLGGGVRFYPREWLAFELGLAATLYPDQPIAQLPATLQRVFVANVGVSFYFPRTFEYVHP